MSAVHLYPLSSALNRAARWTLDSWLACSLQLLPSGQKGNCRTHLKMWKINIYKKKAVPKTGWKFSVCYMSKQAPAWLEASKRRKKVAFSCKCERYLYYLASRTVIQGIFSISAFTSLVFSCPSSSTRCSFIQIQQQVVLQILCPSLIINDAAVRDGWFYHESAWSHPLLPAACAHRAGVGLRRLQPHATTRNPLKLVKILNMCVNTSSELCHRLTVDLRIALLLWLACTVPAERLICLWLTS